MNTIQNLFQQAQLAEAAYSDFAGMSAFTPIQVIKDALIATTFSPTQATAFAAHWRVIDQYTATGWFGQTWLGTGFSATVFQNIDTSEYVFAARGTQPGTLSDWTTNIGDIGADGIDMFNYYQRLIGTKDTLVAQRMEET